MTLVPRKASQPTESLSSDRLALVERYMIDAEEAEARGRAAAKDAEARAQCAAEEQLRREAERAREEAVAQAQRAAEEQLRRETLRARSNAEPARREPEEVLTSEAIAEVEPDEHPAQPA